MTTWRLQLAAQTLTHTQESLARIADRTGYGSEEAFSRAFKRFTGPLAERLALARQLALVPTGKGKRDGSGYSLLESDLSMMKLWSNDEFEGYNPCRFGSS